MNILDLPKAFAELIKTIEIVALPEGNGWKIDGRVTRTQWITFLVMAFLSAIVITISGLLLYRMHKADIARQTLNDANHQLPSFMSRLDEATSQLTNLQRKEQILSISVKNLQEALNKKTSALRAADEKSLAFQESDRLLKIEIDDLRIALDNERKNRFSLAKKEREELKQAIVEYRNAITDMPLMPRVGEVILDCNKGIILRIENGKLFRRCDQLLGAIIGSSDSSINMVFNGSPMRLNLTESISYVAMSADNRYRYDCKIQLLKIDYPIFDLSHSCDVTDTD